MDFEFSDWSLSPLSCTIVMEIAITIASLIKQSVAVILGIHQAPAAISKIAVALRVPLPFSPESFLSHCLGGIT
jgi:hypothetical protein